MKRNIEESEKKDSSATIKSAKVASKTPSKPSLKSPIRLTRIRDLPESENIDTVGLDDILSHDDLQIMWQFNFMMSIPFVMEHISEKCRSHVKSYFVYGYKFSTMDQKQALRHDADMCEYSQNITIEGVRLQTQFATHHSKLMVLIFGQGQQETAQIVIHTANLIPFDWANMTQGVWLSPRLPKGRTTCQFKQDFLAYVGAYQLASTKKLHSTLTGFDFSPIKGIFVASVPGNYFSTDKDYKRWGIARLQDELSKLNVKYDDEQELVCQVSSIGTLGQTDNYLKDVFEDALNGHPFFTSGRTHRVPLRVVFPTVEEVADSLNGYASGSSIHFKRSSDAQIKQLQYLKPRLRKWTAYNAGRARASAHIKSYFRTSHGNQQLEWFLLTSANLSKQAWGTINQKKKNQWIQSWECGVLLHPGCYGVDRLLPVYKRDGESNQDNSLPIRLAFDLPLVPYEKEDVIWSPNEEYDKPDWRGEKWPINE